VVGYSRAVREGDFFEADAVIRCSISASGHPILDQQARNPLEVSESTSVSST